MLSEQNFRRILSTICATIPFGPLLLIGLPPRAGRQLREMGYDVQGEPLFYDWRANSREGRRPYRAVVVGVFDANLASEKWSEILKDAALRSEEDVLYVAYTGRDATGHRAAIEQFAYQNDLRKHPGYYTAVPYLSLENEHDFIVVPLQHLPPETAHAFPIETLLEKRRLNRDMSREYGRRSDARMDRYVRAAKFIRPGDVVLDAACGMGYGSWLLVANTRAGEVIGLDSDEQAVAYARLTFGGTLKPRLSYAQGDVQDLSRFADNAIDFIASFETVEHIDDPERFFLEAHRVLRPGERLMVSVPNRWVDETGRDPNPFHQHVYDWQRLHREMVPLFLPELAIGQTAGGGFRLTGHTRWIEEARFTPDLAIDSEWCLAVCMKSPLQDVVPPYDQPNYRPVIAPEWQLTRFAEQYENPWLMQALVQHGSLRPWRMSDRLERMRLAEAACARYPEGTADHAAALAVLGHALMEDVELDPEVAFACVTKIDRHLARVADERPVAIRWRISLSYLKALLLEAFGSGEDARAAFEECSAIDPLVFSPAIATKTIMSHYRLGRHYALRGKFVLAKQAWQDGVDVCRKVLNDGRWTAVIGDRERPDAVGLFELMDVVSITQQCAAALEVLDMPGEPTPAFWSFADNNKDAWMTHYRNQVENLIAQMDRRGNVMRLAIDALSSGLR